MATKIDVSLLADRMKEKVQDYGKIFGVRLANGFAAKKDFKSLGIKEKIYLRREYLYNLTQPGRSGKINNKEGNAIEFKGKVAELQPAKIDLELDEKQIYALSVSFLANKQPADPKDIHSLAGQDYIVSSILKQAMSEVNAAIVRGQIGYGYDDTDANTMKTSLYQGGLNLFDGLAIQHTAGYATTGPGAVGDIPGSNKISSAAATVTKSNILDEIKKFKDVIYNVAHFEEFVYNDDPDGVDGVIWMPHTFMVCIDEAMDDLPYKADKLVKLAEDGDGYVIKGLERVKIKKRRWMSSVNNMFFAPVDNLFYLHQDTDVDIPTFKIQEVGRSLQFLIDWETAVTYADGRSQILWK